VNAPSRVTGLVTRHLQPCSPGDEGACEMSWESIDADEVLEPELNAKDFARAVKNGKKSVNEDDLERYVNWTTEFGQDG
jgi:vacuolar protein-sorting-associated protein 4